MHPPGHRIRARNLVSATLVRPELQNTARTGAGPDDVRGRRRRGMIRREKYR
jgi:hypothetical protein